MKKLLAALSVVFLLCGAAAADIVYTTSDYTTGELGTIGIGKNSTVSPSLVSSLGGDTAVFSFSDGSRNPRVAVVERFLADDGDRVLIYDTENWNEPLFNLVWPGAINIYGMAASGNMLYVACQNAMYPEEKPSKIVQVSMSDYKPTGKEYAPEPDSEGFYPHATRVLAIGDNIYALFLWEKNMASDHAESKLVKLTANLDKVLAEYKVGPNAVDMVAVNDGNGIVVACAGGTQAVGTTGGLYQVSTQTGKVDPLSNGKDLIKDQMIMGVCYVDPQCLYFVGQCYEANNSISSTLYKWTGPADAADPIHEVANISSETGYSYQVAFDDKNDKIVTLAGDKILVFNLDDELEKTFADTELRGKAYSLTLTDSASSGNSNDESSSGCNAGLTAAFLALAVLPLALRKAHKAHKIRGKNR